MNDFIWIGILRGRDDSALMEMINVISCVCVNQNTYRIRLIRLGDMRSTRTVLLHYNNNAEANNHPLNLLKRVMCVVGSNVLYKRFWKYLHHHHHQKERKKNKLNEALRIGRVWRTTRTYGRFALNEYIFKSIFLLLFYIRSVLPISIYLVVFAFFLLFLQHLILCTGNVCAHSLCANMRHPRQSVNSIRMRNGRNISDICHEMMEEIV